MALTDKDKQLLKKRTIFLEDPELSQYFVIEPTVHIRASALIPEAIEKLPQLAHTVGHPINFSDTQVTIMVNEDDTSRTIARELAKARAEVIRRQSQAASVLSHQKAR